MTMSDYKKDPRIQGNKVRMALLEASRMPNKMKMDRKAGLSPQIPNGTRRADTFGAHRGSTETAESKLGASGGLRNSLKRQLNEPWNQSAYATFDAGVRSSKKLQKEKVQALLQAHREKVSSLKQIGKNFQAESYKGHNNLEAMVMAGLKKLSDYVDPYDRRLQQLRKERRQEDFIL